jgi:hypothetical protein
VGNAASKTLAACYCTNVIRILEVNSFNMRLIKAFLHTFFFTIYYWVVLKLHKQRGKLFGTWRDRGYFLIFSLFTLILLEPIKFLFYCLYVASGFELTMQDVNLYRNITFPVAILSMIYVSIRLKKEDYIEGVIHEILSTDKELIKKRYRYTLYTVVIPFVLSPAIFLLIRKFLQHVIVPMF